MIQMPEPLGRTETGIFPALIPAAQFVPDSPRCVLVTDGEGWFVAVYEEEWPGGPAEWEDAATEDIFDSVILGWMELPDAAEAMEALENSAPH